MSPRSPDTIGQRVKLVRKRLGWTQDELAAAAGEKQPNISKLERGEIQTTTAIARLAGALRVAPRWLELGEGSESDNWTPSQPAPAGVASHPVAQDLRHPEPDDESPKHPWEFIVSVPASDLPKRFRAAMPDDALTLRTQARPVIVQGAIRLHPGVAPQPVYVRSLIQLILSRFHS